MTFFFSEKSMTNTEVNKHTDKEKKSFTPSLT